MTKQKGKILMKYIYILTSVLIGVLFCACGINTLPYNSSDENTADWHANQVQLPPPTEYTLEELTEQAVDFRNYIISSYQTIQELSADEATYEAGKELTKKIEEEYGERIAELADIDFSGMTKEELTEYMSEFTSLTTIIRKAKDALTLG